STADPGGSPRPVAAAATSFAGPHSAARLGGGPRPPGHECDPVSPGISAAVSAPEHRGRQPQLYGGVAKFITWSVVFIIFIIAPLLSGPLGQAANAVQRTRYRGAGFRRVRLPPSAVPKPVGHQARYRTSPP